MLALALVFVVTILLGVPVAFCLGLAGVAFILVSKTPFHILPTLMFGGIDSFPLMAIPFFIMAGDLMSRSGVLPKLVDLADSIVGHFKGGLAYVNNDYDVAEDNSYPAGSWSINFDWFLWKDKIQFFHFDDGFISLEDTDDIIIRTRTGFRFPLAENFNTTIQYNLDWNRNPSPGKKSTDEMFVLSLGYLYK